MGEIEFVQDTLAKKGFRNEVEDLGVSSIWRGRIYGPVNFGAVTNKLCKEKTAVALCVELSKSTYKGCGIDRWRIGTTVCEH